MFLIYIVGTIPFKTFKITSTAIHVQYRQFILINDTEDAAQTGSRNVYLNEK